MSPLVAGSTISVLSSEAAKTHHGSGRFVNPWTSYTSDKTNVWWFPFSFPFHVNFGELMSTKDTSFIKVVKPLWEHQKPLDLKATWLGHASAFVEFPTSAGKERGLRVIFDPVFSDRVSPSTWAGPKRFTKSPIDIENPLPELDICVISHNHYDHMDVAVLKTLHKAQPHVKYFVPLKNAYILHEQVGIPQESITELDWWDSATIKTPEVQDIRIHCVPAQHSSARSIWDKAKSLWAGFVVEHQDVKVYHCGDTGYRGIDKLDAEGCPAFKEIGERFGQIDLAYIPIGAYSPPALFSTVHCNPEEAVNIHQDIRSKKSIGIHWATYVLTDEPVEEPRQRLAKAAHAMNLGSSEFVTTDIGETIIVTR